MKVPYQYKSPHCIDGASISKEKTETEKACSKFDSDPPKANVRLNGDECATTKNNNQITSNVVQQQKLLAFDYIKKMLVNYLTNCMQCTIEKCNEITSILNNADDLVDVLFCNFGSAGIDLSLIKLEEARYDICAFNTNTGSSKIMNSGITDTAALSDGIDTVVHMIEDFKAKKGVNKDLLIDTQKFVKNLQRDQNELKSVTKNKLTYLMHDILKIVGPQKPGDTFSTHASSG